MKALKYLSILLILLTINTLVKAQDKIVLKSKKVIECKIVEVGISEVKYKIPEKRADLTFTLSKTKIRKLIFENGDIMNVVSDDFYDKNNYIDNRPNAIKVNFLSPLTGSFQMSYEHNLKPGMSIEGNAGIIGLGVDPMETSPSGVCFGFGIKFIASPDFYMERMRYAHILKGFYVNPNVQFSFFSSDHLVYQNQPLPNGEYYKRIRIGQSGGALLISVGKQWVFSNIFLVDYNVGFGYGFTNQTEGMSTSYNFTSGNSDLPLAFSTNFRVGFLINGKQKKLREEKP